MTYPLTQKRYRRRLLQCLLDKMLRVGAYQQGFAPIAGEGHEMQIAGFLVSSESPRHSWKLAGLARLCL